MTIYIRFAIIYTCSELTLNGPLDAQEGQFPTEISREDSWKKGPIKAPHLMQSYLTYFNCGNTLLLLVTTPDTRTKVFKWNWLDRNRRNEKGNSYLKAPLSVLTASLAEFRRQVDL